MNFLYKALSNLVSKIGFEVGIENSEENLEDMVDLFNKALSNLVAKIGFEVGIEMAKVSKARVFANYLEIDVHNLEISHKDIASYWVDEVAIVLLELHNGVSLFLDSIHYPSGKLPSTLVMMGNLQ